MRYSQGEKMEIIHLVEHSNLSIKKTLKEVSDGTVDVKEVKFRLRKKDELKDLVDSLNDFIERTVHKQ